MRAFCAKVKRWLDRPVTRLIAQCTPLCQFHFYQVLTKSFLSPSTAALLNEGQGVVRKFLRARWLGLQGEESLMNSNCLGWDCSVRSQDCPDPYVCKNGDLFRRSPARRHLCGARPRPATAIGLHDGVQAELQPTARRPQSNQRARSRKS